MTSLRVAAPRLSPIAPSLSRAYRWTLVIFHLSFVIALSACNPPSAASQITVTDFRSTAESDQYLRDARATQDARDAAIQAIAIEIQTTADAATNTARLAATQSAAATDAMSAQMTETSNVADTATAVAALDATATVKARIAADSTATAVANVHATETRAAEMTSTAVAAAQATGTQAVVATQTTIQLDTQQAAADRAKVVNVVAWIATLICLSILLCALAGLAYVGVRGYHKQSSIVRYGPNGNPLIIADRDHALTVIDPLSNHSPVTVLDGRGVVTVEEMSEPARAQIILAKLLTLYQQAQHSPFAPVPSTTRRISLGSLELETSTGEAQTALPPPLKNSPSASSPLPLEPCSLPPEAPWRLLDDWRGGSLPLGLGQRGLLTADPEQHPHWLIAGATGTGKSRHILKPLIAAALADGWQVLIFDRAMLHFNLFQSHPNAHFVGLDDPAALAVHLNTLHAESQRRFKVLASMNAETWQALGGACGPRVLAVMDDYGIVCDMLDTPQRKALWLATRRLVADSRKSGIHVALVVQSPTWQSLDLGIRRNCTPLTLRVNDADSSRTILNAPGAESLPPRRFLSLLPTLTPGVAFAPDDDQLRAFLTQRSAPALPLPAWLSPLPPAGEGLGMRANVATLESDVTESERTLILDLKWEGLSNRKIEERVFGYTGGAATRKVKAVLENAAPATATTESGATGPVAAL